MTTKKRHQGKIKGERQTHTHTSPHLPRYYYFIYSIVLKLSHPHSLQANKIKTKNQVYSKRVLKSNIHVLFLTFVLICILKTNYNLDSASLTLLLPFTPAQLSLL